MMKSILSSFVFVIAAALSAPAIAQDAANTTSATGTTAKSMQADNTKPHKATKHKRSAGMSDSSTMGTPTDASSSNSTMPDKATGGH